MTLTMEQARQIAIERNPDRRPEENSIQRIENGGSLVYGLALPTLADNGRDFRQDQEFESKGQTTPPPSAFRALTAACREGTPSVGFVQTGSADQTNGREDSTEILRVWSRQSLAFQMQSTVQVDVGGKVKEIPVEQIVSIVFAPSEQ